MRSGLSALKGVLFVTAGMLLMGAKTNGCGPDFEDDGEPPVVCPDGFYFDGNECLPIDPGTCPDGTVEQYVCAVAEEDDGNVGQEQCWLECVPVDPGCPEGTVEQVICADDQPPPPEPGDDPGQEGGDDGMSPPDDPTEPPDPGGECWTECVPVDQCGPGYHEEWVCEDDCNGGGCYPTCVPDCPEECPQGTHKEVVCDEFGCYETCIPDDVCPPGTHLEWECDDTGECYEICIPDEQCPQGTHLEYVCDDFGCYETCVDDGVCPDGTHIEVRCTDDGQCYEECVPDENPCGPGEHIEYVCDDTTMECWEQCVPDENPCPPGQYLTTVCDQMGCYDVCVDGDEPPRPDDPSQP